jgi:putative transposase
MVEVEAVGVESEPDGAPAVWDARDEQLLARLAGRAAAKGLSLAGEGGFPQQMTRLVLQAGLEAEMTSHLGYDKRCRGRNSGNSAMGPGPRP